MMNSWLSTCVPTAKSQEIEVEMMCHVRGICLKAEYHTKPRKGDAKGKIYLNLISYFLHFTENCFPLLHAPLFDSNFPACTAWLHHSDHCSENKTLVGILLIVVIHNYFCICDTAQSFLSGSVRNAFSKISYLNK